MRKCPSCNTELKEVQYHKQIIDIIIDTQIQNSLISCSQFLKTINLVIILRLNSIRIIQSRFSNISCTQSCSNTIRPPTTTLQYTPGSTQQTKTLVG